MLATASTGASLRCQPCYTLSELTTTELDIEMDKRHSSPTSSPRPRTFRKRSNSFPISEALGCSTPEAELLMLEGRAARVKRRHNRRRDGIETFRPQDHMSYLLQGSVVSETIDGEPSSPPEPRAARHARIPSNTSNATDRSTSTIVASTHPSAEQSWVTPVRATSPLGDYSAHLAKFIQSQLNSIPTYRPGAAISPQSCPDLSFPKSPLQSPVKPASTRRHMAAPGVIEIPGVRPPARSAFSAWSSTDDDTDEEAPASDVSQVSQRADTYTPSVLGYYDQLNNSSFLFTSTPTGEEDPDTAIANSYPNNTEFPGTPNEPTSSAHEEDFPSSLFSRPSLLTSSSAPSFSSLSSGSYFEYKMPAAKAATLKPYSKVVPAISPFEGAALANVHDILVQSQQRVLVDGMSFDLARDFVMPDGGARQVHTPY
ncbi:hypothetical protein BU23DRAFT_596099 [Bimuria novae-zelandiae CBS 107.79]|uniref:Uncharacterized protein n=1 Tax=Bimuria novae-zelandiae CBS 107.79 TaxID=1447943 RepID=A0A6A5VS90_9PLEO|nr:hypothetical protein BU23DRAFT_596099 [Bimuria novae-zelandiae CBS 107.79]